MKGNGHWSQLGQTAGSFAAGAAAGSILALLFAPASGRVTRKRIGHQLKQAEKLVAKKASVLREAAMEKLGDTRDWLVERVRNGNGKHPLPRRVMHHA
ncbi:MAG: YtxH domain-containing protein [Candidatus Omnitrophica bacterium]|nr:YtxH domain-containing protein [Candidatus Omnitrophota bacterium]